MLRGFCYTAYLLRILIYGMLVVLNHLVPRLANHVLAGFIQNLLRAVV